jgi:hypothetical protein
MITAPLARDQAGNHFELPDTAAFWRIRRHTGGRPSTVLGPDGEPLFVPIMVDKPDLPSYGLEGGSFRFEAVDADRRPLGVQVAFVELGLSDRGSIRDPRDLTTLGHADLVRSCFDSMTRTMEAMQRAQVERERALAQKERALTDAQVAAQRNHVEVMLALLERAGGGKPQDPITVLKQQMAFQKALSEGTRRNAGLLPAPAEKDASADDEAEGKSKWADALKPFVPAAATTLQELLVKAFAKDDPVAAKQMRRNFAAFAQVSGAMQDGMSQDDAVKMVASEMTEEQVDEATDTSEMQIPRRKALRQVFADLSDDESDRFDDYLDSLSDEEFAARQLDCEALADLPARVAWARGILAGAGVASEIVDDEQDESTEEGPSLPPELVPVLMQLSREERQAGARLIAALDVATVERLTAKLVALPTDEALAMVRRVLANADKRTASVAQRSVSSVLRDDDDATASVTS